MDRRTALSRVAVILGGTIVGAEFFLTGCKPSDKNLGATLKFDAYDITFLDEVAETILPATDTPGAKEAKVGEFMTVFVNDCYDEKNQQIFLDGMKKINEASKKKFNDNFMSISPEQRKELLTEIDKERKTYTDNKKSEDPTHYFVLIKQLTLLGYFSSEVGATKALRYVAIPGRYEGCIHYKKGDRAWAI
ncbi:MAG: gluconate 2-dehydrogenase subunit 3 family protein [Chitinophagaceae bacterium]